MKMSEPRKDNFVSVGLDVGSQTARIFISNSSSQPPSIVPNEIGQRFSLALSAPEPDIESDPMNDQYWDDPKKKKKKDAQKKEVNILVGDAARKSLQRLKKPLDPHTILNMVKQQDFGIGEGESDNGSDSGTIGANPMAACLSYFQHLVNLTTNASHTNPQNLRVVLSTPYNIIPKPSTDNQDGAELSLSASPLNNLTSSVQNGLMKCIDQAGYRKSDKKKIYGEERIIAVLTHPVAIAHAHKLFQPSQAQAQVQAQSQPKSTNSKRNFLILDWGASALSLSHLSISPSGMGSIHKHHSDAALSGKKIVFLLVQHIAELFERKNRCIAAGETISNKKARAKLEVAAEDALRSFGFSQKVTVTIDSLMEGIDCHVDVMLARFEMLLGNILRSAENQLKGFGNFDSVVGAGSIMKLKCVDRMMDRLYPRDTTYRGESTKNVPPDEAVAIGCAMFGSVLLARTSVDGQGQEATSTPEPHKHDVPGELVEEEVPICPISIGLSFVEGDPAAHVLIEKGSPLPVLITKTIDVTGCSSNSIHIVQISDEEKTVGRIEGLNLDESTNTKHVEFTMELSIGGNLLVSLNGGEAIEI
jgi:hypothetical protein